MTKIRANSNTGTLSICFVLATVFILEQLLLPVNPSSAGFYQTSVANYRLLSILINLPILIIWFVAFWGYSRLRVYAKLLGKAPEARGYRLLSTGLAWLAWTLPLTAIVDRLLSSFDIHNSSQSIFTIISNYFNLLMPFVAFIIIFIAAKVLFRSQKPKAREAKYPVFITVFLLLGALYCYLILKTADLSSLSSTNNIYNVPVWLMIISLVIPYLYSWFMGLLATYNLRMLATNIAGVLYKNAFGYLVAGLVAVILSFVAIQYLSAVWPFKSHLVLNYRLVIITFFRVVGGAGFILLAVGANKLKQIEEV